MKNKKGYILYLFITMVITSYVVNAQNNFNKLDEKGNKHGLWKGNYQDTKNPKYEGTFDHGKEVGIFTFFDNTQLRTVIATREFSQKDNSCYTIFYDQKKNKVSEGKLVNKLYEGQWKYYHKASKIVMTIENYSKGNLEGVRTVFYPTGKIAEEANYKNNLKNGNYKRYTEAGIVIEETIYSNNEYNGIATFSDVDGNIASKGKFTNGKKSGIWQFYEKGKLVKQIDMNNPKNWSKAKS